MNECFRCGVSGEKARLFDVIASKSIVKICNNCLSEENFPLIKKPTTIQIKDSEKQQTYRERVKAFDNARIIQNNPTKKEDINLREIVDRNLKLNINEEIKPRPHLVDNFHWIIMRERRTKHISRGQFAKDLGESETLIKMIEQGILPEDDNLIINKIESYLNINLRKQEFKREEKKRDLGFDSVSVKNLTISDLKELKEKRDEELSLNPMEFLERDIGIDSEKKIEEKENKDEELSQEDIDNLIFGK